MYSLFGLHNHYLESSLCCNCWAAFLPLMSTFLFCTPGIRGLCIKIIRVKIKSASPIKEFSLTLTIQWTGQDGVQNHPLKYTQPSRCTARLDAIISLSGKFPFLPVSNMILVKIKIDGSKQSQRAWGTVSLICPQWGIRRGWGGGCAEPPKRNFSV